MSMIRYDDQDPLNKVTIYRQGKAVMINRGCPFNQKLPCGRWCPHFSLVTVIKVIPNKNPRKNGQEYLVPAVKLTCTESTGVILESNKKERVCQKQKAASRHS
jgi:hypothetical protein